MHAYIYHTHTCIYLPCIYLHTSTMHISAICIHLLYIYIYAYINYTHILPKYCKFKEAKYTSDVGEGAPLGIMGGVGVRLRDPLKPLCTTQPRCARGFRGEGGLIGLHATEIRQPLGTAVRNCSMCLYLRCLLCRSNIFRFIQPFEH